MGQLQAASVPVFYSPLTVSALACETYGGRPAPDPVAKTRMSYLWRFPSAPIEREYDFTTHLNSLSLEVRTVFATVSMATTWEPQRQISAPPDGTSDRSAKSTHLLADVERKVLRVLLSVPAGVVEVELLDVAVLKVLCDRRAVSSTAEWVRDAIVAHQ